MHIYRGLLLVGNKYLWSDKLRDWLLLEKKKKTMPICSYYTRITRSICEKECI